MNWLLDNFESVNILNILLGGLGCQSISNTHYVVMSKHLAIYYYWNNYYRNILWVSN